MRIQKKISQHRRDFTAIYECESCGHTKRDYGYDDANFHNNVIPNWSCRECGKKSPSLAATIAPDVPAGAVI